MIVCVCVCVCVCVHMYTHMRFGMLVCSTLNAKHQIFEYTKCIIACSASDLKYCTVHFPGIDL